MAKFNNYKDVFLYIVLISISFVFIDQVGSRIPPFFLLFMMSLLAILWFNLINIKTIKNTYTVCFNNMTLFVSMTFFVGINWLCSIYAPSGSDPFVYLLVNCTTLAILGFLKRFFLDKSKLALLSILLLLLCMIYLYAHYKIIVHRSLKLGMTLGAIGGVTAYFYAITSNRLQQKGNLSSTQILAVRFWPLFFILSGIVVHKHLFYLNSKDFVTIIFMAFATLIAPVYFCQQSIRKIGVSKTSMIFSIIPLCVFILYAISRHTFNLANFIICLAATVALITPYLAKHIMTGTKTTSD